MTLKSFMFVIALLFFTSVQDKTQLVGKWVDEERNISYEFEADNTIIFEQQGISVLVTSYTLTEGNPMQAVFTMEQGAVTMDIPAVIQIVDEETLWIEQFAPGTTPTNFSDRPYQKHILKKVTK